MPRAINLGLLPLVMLDLVRPLGGGLGTGGDEPHLLNFTVVFRFAPQLEALRSYEAKSDIELVALIILYDQLPRNVHRGTPQVRSTVRSTLG